MLLQIKEELLKQDISAFTALDRIVDCAAAHSAHAILASGVVDPPLDSAATDVRSDAGAHAAEPLWAACLRYNVLPPHRQSRIRARAQSILHWQPNESINLSLADVNEIGRAHV